MIVHVQIKIVNKEAATKRSTKLVAKDCDWRTVSAQEFQTELTSNAFITDLSSSMI